MRAVHISARENEGTLYYTQMRGWALYWCTGPLIDPVHRLSRRNPFPEHTVDSFFPISAFLPRLFGDFEPVSPTYLYDELGEGIKHHAMGVTLAPCRLDYRYIFPAYLNMDREPWT
jgi:hypothetical protein